MKTRCPRLVRFALSLGLAAVVLFGQRAELRGAIGGGGDPAAAASRKPTSESSNAAAVQKLTVTHAPAQPKSGEPVVITVTWAKDHEPIRDLLLQLSESRKHRVAGSNRRIRCER